MINRAEVCVLWSLNVILRDFGFVVASIDGEYGSLSLDDAL